MLKQGEKIRELIKKDILFFDGAFGTYFSLLYNEENCETANISAPHRTEKIHRQYAQSGANLLRTNTYSANRFSDELDIKTSEEIIRQGFRIALSVSEEFEDCYPCADIGPISYDPYEEENFDENIILDEYKRIIDIFLNESAHIFVFETMSDISPLDKAIEYLRGKDTDAYIICQFAFRPDGFTKSALGIESVFARFNEVPCDCIGFNCARPGAHSITCQKGSKYH